MGKVGEDEVGVGEDCGGRGWGGMVNWRRAGMVGVVICGFGAVVVCSYLGNVTASHSVVVDI